LHATRVDAARPGDIRLTATRPRVRIGQSLVVLQVMLAMTLLCGAALFMRTLRNLTTIEAGFTREGVLSLQIESTPPFPPGPKTASEHRQANAVQGAMWKNLITRVANLPGVSAAALGAMSPLTGRDRGVGVAIEGRQIAQGKRGTHLNTVSADFF